MKELIVKLETLKESKEWESYIQSLRDLQIEQNKKLLEWRSDEDPMVLCSLSDFLRHEIKFLSKLKDSIKIKDKETKEAIIEWIDRNINGRINVILWKTREFKQDNILEWDSYTQEDLWRTENYWIEWLFELPITKAAELKLKQQDEELNEQANIDEQINALSSLEAEGL